MVRVWRVVVMFKESRLIVVFVCAVPLAGSTSAQKNQALFRLRNIEAAASYRELDPEQLAALGERVLAQRSSAVEEPRVVSPAHFTRLSGTAVADLRTHVSLEFISARVDNGLNLLSSNQVRYMETQLNLTVLCLVVPGPTLLFQFPSVTIGTEARVNEFVAKRLHLTTHQLLQTFWTFTTEATYLPQGIQSQVSPLWLLISAAAH